MALEVNKFTLAGNDIEVVDQYAREQIQEIITTEVTKAYVDNADAALQAQIDALPSKTYVDYADSALQGQINNLPSKTYVDDADSALQGQINNLPSKTYVDYADSALQGQINNLPSKTYVDDADSALQGQINGKQSTITGAATTITDANLTASRVLRTDSNGKVQASPVTATELKCLQGVTSGIQGQINNKFDSSNFTSAQYEQIVSDQLYLYMLNISTLKIMYIRDGFRMNVSSGWTYLTNNGSNIILPEKYRPLTDMYLNNMLPRGNRITFRINADGTIAFNLMEAADTSVLTRINMIYV